MSLWSVTCQTLSERAGEGKVGGGGHSLQPGQVMADTLIRLLGHGKELVHVHCLFLVLDHQLLNPPELSKVTSPL